MKWGAGQGLIQVKPCLSGLGKSVNFVPAVKKLLEVRVLTRECHYPIYVLKG